jgi:hypothetical protein
MHYLVLERNIKIIKKIEEEKKKKKKKENL